MAAGSKTLIEYDHFGKSRVEWWSITTNGTGTVAITPGVTRILYCHGAWTEDIGPNPHVLEFLIAADERSVVISCTGDLVKSANIMIVGY